MNKLFITLYDFFERRRALLCTVLAVLVAAMGAAALQLRFSENITGFFPDGERKAAAAFSNLKIKDKIAVMINAGENAADKADEMMACADSLAARLNADTLFRRYAEVEATFGSELADGMRSFLQGNLPLLLSEADYARMDTLVTPQLSVATGSPRSTLVTVAKQGPASTVTLAGGSMLGGSMSSLSSM